MTDEFERCLVRETLDTFRDFVDSSDGLVGWHLNGDVATWGELDVTVDQVDEALAAWDTRTPTPAVEGDETHTKPVVSQNAPDLKHKPAAPQTGYSWTNSAPQDMPDIVWVVVDENSADESASILGDLYAAYEKGVLVGSPVAYVPQANYKAMKAMFTTNAATLKATSDARIAALQAERDEDANQLDSARHTADVLTARIAELEARLKLWEPPTTVETGSLPPTEKKP